MIRQTLSDAGRSIRRHVLVGIGAVILLAGGVGGWAATAEISSALIASGSIVVDSDVKKVQHPTGGVVGEIFVRNGDHVKAGDPLVRLDETVTRANLAIVTKGLNDLIARKARLIAERDGDASIQFPADLLQKSNDEDVAAVIASERKLFTARRAATAGKKQQLGEQITQLGEQIKGLTAQQEAKAKEIELVHRELDGVRDLWSKRLVPLTQLTALEREAARLEGEQAQLTAAIAQTRGKVAETQLQIIQIDQDISSDVSKELRDVESKIGEFVERKITAEDQLQRTEIRAPQDGTVFQSTVHTVGGVITAGDTIMLVVPEDDLLTVEAKVRPQDIDQIHYGQKATLRFTNFNQRTTPVIEGSVTRISADTSTDQRTGASYYLARVSVTSGEIAKLGDVKLVPGMPVEIFVQTGERTLISYLFKPLHDQLTRALREK